MYSIDDPDAVKQIYGINGPWLKTDWYRAWGDPRDPHHNLFSVRDTQEHATMRRKVAALYSMTAIKNYEPYVDNCVVLLRDQFDAATTSGNTIDLQNWMQCYAFDVVGELTVREIASHQRNQFFHENHLVRTACRLLGIWRT